MAQNTLSMPLEQASGASCLGRTCMKWSEDGELTDVDVQLILQRLVQADDPNAQTILKTVPMETVTEDELSRSNSRRPF